MQKIFKYLFKRFSPAPSLSKRKHSNVKWPTAGDVVLIRDDNIIPKCQWRMGRIEELIPGRDDLIRGVKVKVMSKAGISTTCYRPV